MLKKMDHIHLSKFKSGVIFGKCNLLFQVCQVPFFAKLCDLLLHVVSTFCHCSHSTRGSKFFQLQSIQILQGQPFQQCLLPSSK